MRIRLFLLAAAFAALTVTSYSQNPPANPTNLGNDSNGNPLRKALKTGHISNYDESKVAPYTLPDPLVMSNGDRVRNASMWVEQRRPELIRIYENEIYGRVPANAPKVTWQVSETNPAARDGAAVMKKVVGTVGPPTGPKINLNVYIPANALTRVPIILLVNFGGGPQRGGGATTGEPPVAADILAHGWGYATVGYQDIQPDRANSWKEGVIGLTFESGQTEPHPDEWGAISAWAWGISRIIDYFETDTAIDGKQIAVHGFSRLGKTVLWAAAKDERIAAVFSACAGEMGSALARRDWGETVDDMAQNFGWQFAGNLQKYVGRWNDMPADAHMLIALSAPRPVFITGGTADQWADPKGEFLAEVAAGPVYRLLGKKGVGVTEFPAPDSPVMSGELAFNYHTGPHQVTATEWRLFVEFLGRYFK